MSSPSFFDTLKEPDIIMRIEVTRNGDHHILMQATAKQMLPIIQLMCRELKKMCVCVGLEYNDLDAQEVMEKSATIFEMQEEVFRTINYINGISVNTISEFDKRYDTRRDPHEGI